MATGARSASLSIRTHRAKTTRDPSYVDELEAEPVRRTRTTGRRAYVPCRVEHGTTTHLVSDDVTACCDTRHAWSGPHRSLQRPPMHRSSGSRTQHCPDCDGSDRNAAGILRHAVCRDPARIERAFGERPARYGPDAPIATVRQRGAVERRRATLLNNHTVEFDRLDPPLCFQLLEHAHRRTILDFCERIARMLQSHAPTRRPIARRCSRAGRHAPPRRQPRRTQHRDPDHPRQHVDVGRLMDLRTAHEPQMNASSIPPTGPSVSRSALSGPTVLVRRPRRSPQSGDSLLARTKRELRTLRLHLVGLGLVAVQT